MLTMILRRIFLGLATISIVSLIIFAGVEILPGDACTQYLEQDQADVELLEKCREDLNLNRPAHQRYTEWALGALTGDAELDAKAIGKIAIADNVTHVAISRAALRQAMSYLSQGKVKGRAIRARHLGFIASPSHSRQRGARKRRS